MALPSSAKSGFCTTYCTGWPKPPNAAGTLANARTPGMPKNCGCTSPTTCCTVRRRLLQSVSRANMIPWLTRPWNPTMLKYPSMSFVRPMISSSRRW